MDLDSQELEDTIVVGVDPGQEGDSIPYDYVLLFPLCFPINEDYRLTYNEALRMVEQCVGGDDFHEEMARREFKRAWQGKFRTGTPSDTDTLFKTSFIEVSVCNPCVQ